MRKMFLFCTALIAANSLLAAENTLVFEPARTQIHWTLDTLLHTVHGTFQLRGGTVHYDAQTGRASGELIVDARSGASGSNARDSRMHSSILESAKYTDIVFRPDHVDGAVPAHGDATIRVHGQFVLHGQAREMTLPIQLHVGEAETTARASFPVAYLQWGLKNPSTFILKVADKVQIDLTSVARTTTEGGK